MTMVVYADMLLVTAFLYILSCIILFGLIYNYHIRLPAVIVGSMAGALLSTYIFVLFLKTTVPKLLYLLFFMLLMAISLGISYKFESKRIFLKSMLSLFVIGLCEAGVSVLLLTITAHRIKNWQFLYIAFLIFIQIVAIIILFRQNNKIKLYRQSVILEIKNVSGERIRALVDSGNVLKDPVYGRPVIIFSHRYKERLKQVIKDKFTVPCFTVNGTSLLEGGFISELVVVKGKNERIYYNIPVAFGSVGLTKDGFEAIIPTDYAGGLK
ncbi:MAG: sigma-E processing peptidase SpoIIGA [Lachnospiraceae bacterium]